MVTRIEHKAQQWEQVRQQPVSVVAGLTGELGVWRSLHAVCICVGRRTPWRALEDQLSSLRPRGVTRACHGATGRHTMIPFLRFPFSLITQKWHTGTRYRIAYRTPRAPRRPGAPGFAGLPWEARGNNTLGRQSAGERVPPEVAARVNLRITHTTQVRGSDGVPRSFV